MTVSVDGKKPVDYHIEGKESMGNGATLQTGHGSAILSNGKGGIIGLANRTLTIGGLFRDEIVDFPLSQLDPETHTTLKKCF